MQSVVYREDPTSIRKHALMMGAVGLVAVIMGAPGVVNMATTGIIEFALSAGLLGGGLALLVLCVKGLLKLRKPMTTLVLADESGVSLYLGPKAAVAGIPWEEIRSFRTAQKGINRGVVVELEDEDYWLSTLAPDAQKLARQNRGTFRALAAVNVTNCAAASQQIVAALSSYQRRLLESEDQ